MKNIVLNVVILIGLMFQLSSVAEAQKKPNPERKAYIEKVNKDDGSNLLKLEKEGSKWSGRFGHSQDIKTALGKLRTRHNTLLSKMSVMERLGFSEEDIFDPDKVVEAFSKVPKSDLFKMPKNWKPTETRPFKIKHSAYKRTFSIEKPEVDWFKKVINYKIPGTKLPADTVVLFWGKKNRMWLVVTPAGVTYKIKPLNFSHRGVKGLNDGNWKDHGFSYVHPDEARKLVQAGVLKKGALKKFEKQNKAMWKCNGSIMKKVEAQRKTIKNKNRDAKIRAEKLKKLNKKSYKTRDAKCTKHKTKVEKELTKIGDTLAKQRGEVLNKVLATQK